MINTIEHARGRWLVGDLGQRKIERVSSAFFQSCIDRLKLDLNSYEPWMSNDSFCKKIAERETVPPNSELSDDIRGSRFLGHLEKTYATPGYNDIFDGFDDVRDLEFADIPALGRTVEAKVFADAQSLISNWFPWQQTLYKTIVKAVYPIRRKGRKDRTGVSFSHPFAIGALFASVDAKSPFPDITLNITLAHELGHQVLMLYEYSGDMILEPNSWIYSGVRKTLRPARAALHAAVALTYMVECTRALIASEKRIDRFAFLNALLRDQREYLGLGLAALASVPCSNLCRLLADDMTMVLKN